MISPKNVSIAEIDKIINVLLLGYYPNNPYFKPLPNFKGFAIYFKKLFG